jgi:NAD+ synthase (glutamine-hydrolysing)
MRDGFIKVAAGTPKIKVADCRFNAEACFTMMRDAYAQGVRVLALPELCLTGYTCADLFFQDTLLRGAEDALTTVLAATRSLDLLAAIGLPVKVENKLYNCAAVIHKGEVLGVVPKTCLPNYGEFYEKRWFAVGPPESRLITLCQQETLFGTGLIFHCETMPSLTVGVEICEDLWAVTPLSNHMAAAGGHTHFKPLRQ